MTLHLLLNIKPDHAPVPLCACHSKISISRVSSVGGLLKEISAREGLDVTSISLLFNDQPVAGFNTFEELGASNGDRLEITVHPCAVESPFVSVFVGVEEENSPQLLIKVKRKFAVVSVMAFYSRIMDLAPPHHTLFLRGEAIEDYRTFEDMAVRDLESLIIRRNENYVPHKTVVSCPLVGGTCEDVTVNDTPFIPVMLFDVWVSPVSLSSARRDCFLLLAHALKRIIPSCNLHSIMQILLHTRLEVLLAYAMSSSDASIHAATTAVLHTICNHLRTMFDGQRVDMGYVVVSPHPLVKYYSVLQSAIKNVLENPASRSNLWVVPRLSFLLTLCLPRCGLAPIVRVEYHPHSLHLIKRQTSWRCSSCNESFPAENSAIRYHCTDDCDFDVCGACMPFPVPDTVLQPLDTTTVLKLFELVYSSSSILSSSPDSIRAAVLLFTMARTADLMVRDEMRK